MPAAASEPRRRDPMQRILIVDDSVTMRKIIKRVLRQSGLDIEEFLEASDGIEALELVGAHPDIGLIVSDVNMPRMDGVAFVEAIRARQGTGRIPVVMITGMFSEGRVREAMDAGADGWVPKPFTSESLCAALAHFVEGPGDEPE